MSIFLGRMSIYLGKINQKLSTNFRKSQVDGENAIYATYASTNIYIKNALHYLHYVHYR